MTDLLRLPVEDGDRVSRDDGLAEAILAHPRVQALLLEAGKVAAAQQDDPEFRARLEEALVGYAGTRAAAAEITTGLDRRSAPAPSPSRRRRPAPSRSGR